MKLKRFCAGLAALCMMGAVVPVLPVQKSAVISANAEDAEYTEGTYENLKYKKYADYIEISGVLDEENTTEVNIPSEIDNLPVTSIGINAFNYLMSSSAMQFCDKLTSIIIPNTVTNIGRGAFANCSGLTSIIIPESVTSIGESAFSGCSNLIVTVSKNNPAYASEDDVLFNKDKTLLIWYSLKKAEKEYTIPNGVTSIGNNAFSGCSSLTSIIIPDSVTSIEAWAFDRCSGLKSIIIPKNVVSIGGNAFINCKSLTSVTISNPDCKIERFCISNNVNFETYQYEFSGTIYGYEDSTAQAYAENSGYNFALIGSESETEELRQGDADGNGEIDILDVITINKAIMGKESLSENGLKAIDFNGNGKPDSDEALTLLKYIVGLITSFES